MRIYLDAAPVIYMVERVAPFFEIVAHRLEMPEVVRVASELTRMECRVKPLQDARKQLMDDFDRFFADTEMVALAREVMDRATVIRAHYGFKTPDAIHLAAALVSGCDAFLTNDHRLDRFADIAIEVVQP